MIKSNTIRQLLEVLAIFYNSHSKGNPINRSYHEAVRRVSQKHGVTYQTIGDGCRRRLKLNDVGELYTLLERWIEGDPRGLISVLKSNTNSHNHEEIERFFKIPPSVTNHSEKYGPVKTNAFGAETFSFQLPQKDARILRATSEIEGKPVLEILTQIVSKSIRNRMRELAHDIIRDSQTYDEIQHQGNSREQKEPEGIRNHQNIMEISKDIRNNKTTNYVLPTGRKTRDPQSEAILKKSLGNLIKSEWKEEFYKKGDSQLIFSPSGKRLLCKYSSFKSDQSRWFWGVPQKYWANWDSQDQLVLIMENEDSQGFSYLLLDSQESRELFKRCSESNGEKKINMRIYLTGGGTRLQEWQELNVETRIKPLPVNSD